jgi:hypothetical protein
MSTSNYRITVEATPLDSGQTFLHFSFSHSYGFAARTAMQIYLKTLARAKVGFTIIGKRNDGQPIYIGDVRGMVERNAMRYYLAIDTALKVPNTPADQQREKRLRNWFLATERYPLQLREVTQNEYLEMKRREYLRIETTQKN